MATKKAARPQASAVPSPVPAGHVQSWALVGRAEGPALGARLKKRLAGNPKLGTFPSTADLEAVAEAVCEGFESEPVSGKPRLMAQACMMADRLVTWDDELTAVEVYARATAPREAAEGAKGKAAERAAPAKGDGAKGDGGAGPKGQAALAV